MDRSDTIVVVVTLNCDQFGVGSTERMQSQETCGRFRHAPTMHDRSFGHRGILDTLARRQLLIDADSGNTIQQRRQRSAKLPMRLSKGMPSANCGPILGIGSCAFRLTQLPATEPSPEVVAEVGVVMSVSVLSFA
jgi:hypothetical protein